MAVQRNQLLVSGTSPACLRRYPVLQLQPRGFQRSPSLPARIHSKPRIYRYSTSIDVHVRSILLLYSGSLLFRYRPDARVAPSPCAHLRHGSLYFGFSADLAHPRLPFPTPKIVKDPCLASVFFSLALLAVLVFWWLLIDSD